jgi:hypothetical protein
MNDMKFTTAQDYMESSSSILSPHGKTKASASWVVKTYENRTDYPNNATFHRWVKESQRVLNDPLSLENMEISA